MKYVRIIDKNGLFVTDEFVEELTEFTIETPCPQGFILPKWNGTEWVEGGVKSTEIIVPQPTIEEKVEQMQATLSTVIDTLAEIVGVE